jgi:hypothetical protein
MFNTGHSPNNPQILKRPVNPKRSSIRIAPHTKDYLDKILQEPGVETYDQAILYLIRERRKNLLSSFGALPNIGHFVREEDDSYRLGH